MVDAFTNDFDAKACPVQKSGGYTPLAGGGDV